MWIMLQVACNTKRQCDVTVTVGEETNFQRILVFGKMVSFVERC